MFFHPSPFGRGAGGEGKYRRISASSVLTTQAPISKTMMTTDKNDELMEIEAGEADEDVTPEDNQSPAFNPRKIDITSEQNSLSTILAMIGDGTIDLNPEFQRKGNLWSETSMSRLIESILLQVPIPAFYFDASEGANDEKWLVVDGLQRLWTLKQFVIDKTLVLKNLTLLKDLNDKQFEELDKNLQRRMQRYQITTYLIKPNTPKIVRYDIFRRINTGGLVLTPQEIRHVLNQGKPAEYLKKLSEDERFKEVIRVSDKRMADRELILRYLAFSNKHYTEYKPPMIDFLNEAMENLGKLNDQRLDQLEQNLWNALKICQDLFGKDIFSKSIIGNKHIFNTALFDLWTVLIGSLSDREIERLRLNKNKLIGDFKSLLNEGKISTETPAKNVVITRFQTIESLINKYKV